jgi:2'-5' RNA ligase
MENKALYVLAGYDEMTEGILSNLQQKLFVHGFSGTQTPDIPGHITLGSFDTSRETELVEKLQAVAKGTGSIKITFSHVGIFGGSKVIFVAPDTNHPLLTLKEEFGDSDHWTAHTTMLIDDPEVIFHALPVLLGHFKAFSGYIEYLYLYEFWPTRLIRKEKLRLGE